MSDKVPKGWGKDLRFSIDYIRLRIYNREGEVLERDTEEAKWRRGHKVMNNEQ